MWIVLGLICTVVAAYYCAAGMREGETIFLWQERMKLLLEDPFKNYINTYTGKVILVFLLIYLLIVLMYVTSRKNYLTGREMGSAQYADVKKVNQRLADLSKNPDDSENIVLLKRSRLEKWRDRLHFRKGRLVIK